MRLRARIQRSSITGTEDRAHIIFVLASSSRNLLKRQTFEYSIQPFEQHPIFRPQHVLEEAAGV